MKIESKIGKSNFSANDIYSFVSDFRSFDNFIPKDKISNWQADIDTCSFKMDLLGSVHLSIVEREATKLVKISSDPAVSQYNFNLWIQIKQVGVNDSRIKVSMEPLLNKVMLSMVKGPLKSFVDNLIDEIEAFDFSAK